MCVKCLLQNHFFTIYLVIKCIVFQGYGFKSAAATAPKKSPPSISKEVEGYHYVMIVNTKRT